MGNISDRCSVYPLHKESQNGNSLQDYLRRVGFPQVLNMDNAQSEMGGKWKDHFQRHCIERTTTEPHSPWESPT